MPQQANRSYSLFDFIAKLAGRQDTTSGYGHLHVITSGRTNSGENVNVDTLLEEPTTMSCINIITQGITQIPYYVKRENEDGSVEKVEGHPIGILLNRPNVFQTPTDFKQSIINTMLVHGNAFIRILRANQDPADGTSTRGRPVQLVPMDPQDITVGANEFGMPTYEHESFGQIVADNMIHIRDLSVFTAQGLSRPLLAAEIIGAKLAADRKIAEHFKNGVDINYVIRTNETLDPETREAFQTALKEKFGSEGDRRGGAFIVENGDVMSLKGSTPADVDLRELRANLINEIAGVFKVPSFMVGGTGNDKYNNVRQRLSSFHRDTLQPLITNIEEALTMKLLDAPNEYICFDVTDFIKGDIESQTSVSTQLVTSGVITPNEARAYLNYNPHTEEHANELIKPNQSFQDTETTTGGEDGSSPDAGEDGDA